MKIRTLLVLSIVAIATSVFLLTGCQQQMMQESPQEGESMMMSK